VDRFRGYFEIMEHERTPVLRTMTRDPRSKKCTALTLVGNLSERARRFRVDLVENLSAVHEIGIAREGDGRGCEVGFPVVLRTSAGHSVRKRLNAILYNG